MLGEAIFGGGGDGVLITLSEVLDGVLGDGSPLFIEEVAPP